MDFLLWSNKQMLLVQKFYMISADKSGMTVVQVVEVSAFGFIFFISIVLIINPENNKQLLQ